MSSGVVAVSELSVGLATVSNYEKFMVGAPSDGIIAQTMPRIGVAISTATPLVSGRESMVLIWLDAGQVVRSITFWSAGTAAVTPTNQWFTLRDLDRRLLGVTVDNTTTPWGTITERNLALPTPVTIPSSGFYYIGIMVAAGTVPSLLGVIYVSGTLLASKPPIVCGHDATNVGLTTPATAPAVSAALTTNIQIPYATLQ